MLTVTPLLASQEEMQEEIKHRRASRGSASSRASLTNVMSRAADAKDKEGVCSDLSDHSTDVLSALAEVAELDDKESGFGLDAASTLRKTVRMMPSQENIVVTLYDYDDTSRSDAMV